MATRLSFSNVIYSMVAGVEVIIGIFFPKVRQMVPAVEDRERNILPTEGNIFSMMIDDPSCEHVLR